MIFPDGRGGVAHNWKTGEQRFSSIRGQHSISEDERSERCRQIQLTQQAAHQEREAGYARAARVANLELARMSVASSSQPYLSRKSIEAIGVFEDDGALVIPIVHGDEIVNLQRIRSDGQKRFMTGARLSGCYHIIGSARQLMATLAEVVAVIIAEGFATATSVYMATGLPALVAFSGANMRRVCVDLRLECPQLPIIVAADDDFRHRANPGLHFATEASRAVNAILAVPDFGPDRPEKATDFNDLHQLRGLPEVRRQIVSAIKASRGRNENTKFKSTN